MKMTKWDEAAIGCALLGIFSLFIFVFTTMDPTPDTLKTTFTSPSGAVTIQIKERRFAFACSQEAFLVENFKKTSLGRLDLGEQEDFVFGSARVRWNEDETEMSWHVRTPHGIKRGAVTIK